MLRISRITAEKLRAGKYRKKFQELYELKDIVENDLWHDHEPVFDHVVNTFHELRENLLKFDFLESPLKKRLKESLDKKIEKKSRKDLLLVATLLHDIGKKEKVTPRGDRNGYTQNLNHAAASYRHIKEFQERFGLTDAEVHFVGKIVLYHNDVHDLIKKSIDEAAARKGYLEIIKDITGNVYHATDVYLETLLLCFADTLTSNLKKSNPMEFEKRVSTYKEMIQSY